MFCCSDSRERLRGRSSLSTTPRMKDRYSGMRSSQLSMMNTRRTYSLMELACGRVGWGCGETWEGVDVNGKGPRHDDYTQLADDQRSTARTFFLEFSNRSKGARLGTNRMERNSSCPSTEKCFCAMGSSQSLVMDL